MITFKFNNCIFLEDAIKIKRSKGDSIIVKISDIKFIDYRKPTLINYIVSSTWFGGTYPGRLQIHLKNKVDNTKLYLIKINHNDFLKLPIQFKKILL